jgi:hypothetical protein
MPRFAMNEQQLHFRSDPSPTSSLTEAGFIASFSLPMFVVSNQKK